MTAEQFETHGREHGHAEGLAAGRRDAYASAAVEVMRLRGIALSDDVAQRLTAMEVTREALMAAATRCTTEADFWARVTTNH